MSSETQLAAQAIGALQKLGALCVRIHSGQAIGRHGGHMQLAKKGTPDWLVVFRGALLLEFKRPGEEPTAEQLEWHARARARGVEVYVVRSVEQALRVVTGRAA